jgi:hypothetical protein
VTATRQGNATARLYHDLICYTKNYIIPRSLLESSAWCFAQHLPSRFTILIRQLQQAHRSIGQGFRSILPNIKGQSCSLFPLCIPHQWARLDRHPELYHVPCATCNAYSVLESLKVYQKVLCHNTNYGTDVEQGAHVLSAQNSSVS